MSSPSFAGELLLDVHERAHRGLRQLLAHCGEFDAAALARPLDGFGQPTLRGQFHHLIGAEEYWIGVLQERIEVDENDAAYPTADALEAYRARVAAATADYLRGVPAERLNAARRLPTWGGRERLLVPAYVVLRTITHLYHHQGQIAAMCRLLGRPVPPGLDFPPA